MSIDDHNCKVCTRQYWAHTLEQAQRCLYVLQMELLVLAAKPKEGNMT